MQRPASLRRIATGALVLAATVLPAFAASTGAQSPPNRYFGTVNLDGAPAPPGTPLVAYINGIECGQDVVGEEGFYRLDVASDLTTPGCGVAGVAISFRVGDLDAGEIGIYADGMFSALDLNAPGLPPTELPPPPEPEQPPFEEELPPFAAELPPAPFLYAEVYLEPSEENVIQADDARVNGLPYLQVTRVLFAGVPEVVEVTNLGGGAQDMTGWSLAVPPTGAYFAFPEGFVLEPGQSVLVYGGDPFDDPAAAGSFGFDGALPDEGGQIVLMNADGAPVVDTGYTPDPFAQPETGLRGR